MEIPRANTQKNVNKTVYKMIEAELKSAQDGQSWLDSPCGTGEFALFIKTQAPQLQVTGVDLFAEVSDKSIQFIKQSAHDYLRNQKANSLDFVTCISGVMCFDGVYELSSLYGQAIKPNGTLVITNDNVMTIRDRLNFLFFGHFKRFKLLYSQNEGNWNVVLPQAIYSLLKKNNFDQIKVKYTSLYAEDFLFLPLAVLIYPFFFLYLVTRKNEMTLKERLQLFPFLSLIARHYVVRAKKSKV